MTVRATTFIAAALLASSASARIGETEAQIAQRYGQPVPAANPQPDRKVYKFKDFTISVVFRDGRSVQEQLWKGEEMSMEPSIVKGLLGANAPAGTHWERYGGDNSWKRSDGKAMADLVAGTFTVSLLKKGELEKAEKMLDQAEKDKTKGF